VQGFYFAPPLQEPALLKLLREARA
jgi:EAL domain-containing protein (putative c-di-GMP-specific phosphodiesterase class I)